MHCGVGAQRLPARPDSRAWLDSSDRSRRHRSYLRGRAGHSRMQLYGRLSAAPPPSQPDPIDRQTHVLE